MSTIDLLVDQLSMLSLFGSGFAWARIHPLRRPIEVVSVDRLPVVMQQQIDDMRFDAMVSGPGFTCIRKGTITVDGIVVQLTLTCDTSQFAPAPDKEARL